MLAFAPVRLSADGVAGLPNVRFRFRVFTDAGTNFDGWYVDDVRVIGRQSDVNAMPPLAAYAPALTEILAASGAPAGGNSVRLIGANFSETADTKVLFGNVAATNVVVLNRNLITCTVPAATQALPVTVRVENRYGAAQLVNGYTYYRSTTTPTTPTVLSLSPDSGSVRGNTLVTVTGQNFTPETRLQFGTQAAANVQFISSQMLRVTTPAAPNQSAGAVNLLVSHNLNLLVTLNGAFTYTAPTPPTVSVLAPNGGEQFFLGSTVTARWRSQDNRAIARHRVELHAGTGAASRKISDLTTELPGNAQSYNWVISAGLVTGNEYRVRVIAIDDEGAESDAFSGNVFRLARRWASAGNLLQAVQRPAVTSDGQNLYVFGGRTGTGSTSTIALAQKINPNASSPETLAPMPTGLNAAEAAYLNGKIYIAGGINAQVTQEQQLFVYDLAANTWATAAAPPADLFLYSLVADETRNVLYQIGGIEFASGDVSRKVYRYSMQSDRWDELPAMSAQRWGHESALIGGQLYVAGGANDTGGLASAEFFDFSAQRWTTLASLSAPRRYALNGLARTTDGRAFWLIAGGENANNSAPFATTEAFELATNRWVPLDDSFNLSAVRSLTAGASADGALFAVAGFNGANNTPTLERLPLNDLTFSNPNQPPLLVVPANDLAFVGAETVLTVNGYDYAPAQMLTLTAQGLPAGARFEEATNRDGSVTGRLHWTPTANDANQIVTITFTVSDGQLSDTRAVTLRIKNAAPLAAVNAASYRSSVIAPDQIGSIFGAGLAAQTAVAQTTPLPTTLSGTSVTVNGIAAPLFFVSSGQINFLMPPATGLGTAQIVVRTAQDTYSLGSISVVPTVPALFTNDATGQGAAAAVATTDGVTFQIAPFDVIVNARPNFLLLFGTGLRRAATEHPNDANGVAESVRVTIEGQAASVIFAGAQGGFAGLDQLNIELPASLAGRGERNVEVFMTVNGIEANRVTVRVK
jgi:uncharacterized protein (TIGR03437 family)